MNKGLFLSLALLSFKLWAIELDLRQEFIRAKKAISSLPPYNLKLHGSKLEGKLLSCLKQGHRVIKGGQLSLGDRSFKSFGAILKASNYSDSSFIYEFYPSKDSMELLGRSLNQKLIEALRVDDEGNFLIEESLRSIEDLKHLPLLISPIYTFKEAQQYLETEAHKSHVYSLEIERPLVLSYSKCGLFVKP